MRLTKQNILLKVLALQSKLKTKLLILAVILIWGYVIGYVFFANYDSSEIHISNAQIAITENEPMEVEEKFEFVLHDIDRDPFFGTINKKSSSSKMGGSSEKIINSPKTVVEYLGQVKSSRQTIFILTINGNQVLLKKGQKNEGVKLFSGSKNLINVLVDGKRKSIPIKSNAN